MNSNHEQTLQKILDIRISAIIRAGDQRVAANAMDAAVAGGFRLIEFTLTTPGAFELISTFSKREEELVVGAGTVMTTEEARLAVDAGARFLVSPISDPAVIAQARELDVVIIPGTFTATEMATAHRLGADLVKLFPAPANLPDYIRFLLGPMPYLKIFPTAGVTLGNMLEVLRAGAAGAGFVGSLFTPEEMASKNFEAIEKRAGRIVARMEELT